jgi:hypothetical protein
MERETGFEPATSSLGSWHSTTELLPHHSAGSSASLGQKQHSTTPIQWRFGSGQTSTGQSSAQATNNFKC